MSGQNSRSILKPTSHPIVMPNVAAPEPAVAIVPGIQTREMNEEPAALPTLDTEKRRVPLSRRARKLLAIAYRVLCQKPVPWERKYRLSSWRADERPYFIVPRMICCAMLLPNRVP